MISINLIDWRNQQIRILNRRFGFVAAMAVAVWLVLAFFIYLMIHSQVNAANSDMEYLDAQLQPVAGVLTEIKTLQAQKDALLSKRKTIEALQASRPLVIEIFDNLVRAMPDGVVLSGMSRKGDEVILSGSGDSNYSISVLMDNIQHLPWVKSAKLGELKYSEPGSSASSGIDTNSNAGQKSSANPTVATAVGKSVFSLNITINPIQSGVQNATT